LGVSGIYKKGEKYSPLPLIDFLVGFQSHQRVSQMY